MKTAAAALVVLTLNASGPRRIHQGWPTRREAIVSRLKAAPSDAAAYQELWREEDARALAEASGHPYIARDEAGGLLITSRAPILASASRDLGFGRRALRARVRDPKGAYDVYTARLEPAAGPARRGQLFRLAEFVREGSSGRPFVLLGDLGASPEERDAALLLDLLEARDLCVSHGDEICGRTMGERRVDYVLIPYSSRRPRLGARAEFTEVLAEEPYARFGLRAELEPSFRSLAPAAEPAGRAEALEELEGSIGRAEREAAGRTAVPGWLPYLTTRRLFTLLRESEELGALLEEIRTASIRASRAGGR